MRVIALLPLLCMIAATVLAVLCIMAGYKQSFMENFELLTFNTSLLGEGIVNEVANGILSDIPGGSTLATTTINLPPAATSVLPSSLVNALDGLSANQILNSVARQLNIHDFYKIHILDFCEGYYEPGAVPNATFTAQQITQNITYCSPAQAFSYFNATEVLMNELAPGVDFSQLQFPSQVQDAITAMATVQKVMFVLYCVGVGVCSLATIGAIIAFLGDGRVSAICNALLDMFAFLCIGIASGLATAFMTVVATAANQYGAQVNLQVYKGTNFLIITWIATALTLISSILWCFSCCVGPSRKKQKAVY